MNPNRVILEWNGRSWKISFLTVMIHPMDDLETRIGQRMADLRRSADRSQETVAERLGVSQATISKWEKGRLPTMRELIRYAQAIGRPLADLLEPALAESPRPLTGDQRKLAEALSALLAQEDDEA